jgi:putative sterol carrier protein
VAQHPDVTLTTDEETFADLASGQTTASAAAAAGTLTFAGDRAAKAHLKRIMSRPRVLAQAERTVAATRQRR